jgi:serine/threonine protein kinase
MANEASVQDGELRPGDVCDGYRIVSLIAAGGMGDIYEAVHGLTGKMVAIKCLKVHHRDKEDARARMKMEAVVLSELRHPNLVRVYDAGVTERGAVWIAMERLCGQTLRDLLHGSGCLSIPDALHYAAEIADGVGAVHEANVIHRDLKPENVFITDKRLVKVLDLGTGKFTGYGLKSTDGARVVGTTAYMAPEQIKGLRLDPRADVYALGLILYEMIAGRHALADDSAGLPAAIEQVALLQLQATPSPLTSVLSCPTYVSSLVDRAMSKDRAHRPPSMAAFAADLRALGKRFIADTRLDGSSVGLRTPSDALREKLGAPRRSSSPPPHPDLLQTEIKGPPDFTQQGSSRAPTREPTLELSLSSMSPLPSGTPLPNEIAVARAASSDVVEVATRTNPIAFGRSIDLTPEPLSLTEQRLLTGWWRSRMAMTLCLGAVIGVPPAVMGVLWWTDHRGGRPAAESAPRSITETEPSAPTVPFDPPAEPQALAAPAPATEPAPLAAAAPEPPVAVPTVTRAASKSAAHARASAAEASRAVASTSSSRTPVATAVSPPGPPSAPRPQTPRAPLPPSGL